MLEGQLTKEAEVLQRTARVFVILASLPAIAGAFAMFFIDYKSRQLGAGPVPICIYTGIVVLLTIAYGAWYFFRHVPALSIRSFALTDDELVVTTVRNEEVRSLLSRLQTVQMVRGRRRVGIRGYWIGFETGWLWLSNGTTSARPLIDELERILKTRT